MYFLSAYYLLILCSFLLTYKGFGGLVKEKYIRIRLHKIIKHNKEKTI